MIHIFSGWQELWCLLSSRISCRTPTFENPLNFIQSGGQVKHVHQNSQWKCACASLWVRRLNTWWTALGFLLQTSFLKRLNRFPVSPPAPTGDTFWVYILYTGKKKGGKERRTPPHLKLSISVSCGCFSLKGNRSKNHRLAGPSMFRKFTSFSVITP